MTSFFKPLPNHTQAEIDELFVHAGAIHRELLASGFARTPSPLEQNQTGIIYEWVDLPPSLTEHIRARTPLTDLAQRAGKALASLHTPTPHGTLLHADFVLHNLLGTKEQLIIIDCHPPAVLGPRPDLLYGDARRDLAVFAISLFSSTGVKASLLRFKEIKNLCQIFLAGYASIRPLPPHLRRILPTCLCELYTLRRRAGFSALGSLAHVSLAGLMAFLSLRSSHEHP